MPVSEAAGDHVRGLPASPAAARARRREAGSVTAETAAVLPVLVALTLGLVWLLSLAVTQVRVVDAAREVARAAAREEAGAVALGRRVAPAGARITVREGVGEVTVVVQAAVRGPGGLFAFLPAFPVEAEAVAAKEPS